MKRLLFILLLIVLNINLFGQVYYVKFDYKFEAGSETDLDLCRKIFDYVTLSWKWSDKTGFDSQFNYIKDNNGIYKKKINELAVTYSSNGLEVHHSSFSTGKQSATITNNDDFRIVYFVEQYEIVPHVDLVPQYGNYYCASDNLTFYLDGLKDLSFCKDGFDFYFRQNNSVVYSEHSASPKISMSYNRLCQILNPLEKFDLEVKFKDKKDTVFTTKNVIFPIYPYVKVDESQLRVVDSKFYYPQLKGTQKISFQNIKTALNDTLSSLSIKPLDLENYYGPYNITIQEDNKCPITKSFIYPELKYNYVDKAEQYNFWYSGEERNSMKLSLYVVDTDLKNVGFSDLEIPCVKENPIRFDSKIYYKSDGGKPSTYPCKEYIYLLCTTDTLSKITITGNKDFIPVTRNIELKSYPQIDTVNIDTIVNAVCYYDTAIVKVSGTKGGLGKEYKFKLEKDGKEFWSENSSMKIPATIFGGNEQEVKLYVYDKDSISDDTGREKRAFSTNIKFKYGETLDIIDTNVVDLLCFEDNSGKILITDWTPKNDDIKFEVWNSEKRVSESDITENLAAGDYNLKIIDGNKCVNDSFQVTLNQPDPLEISKDTVKNPVCFGYSNGRIITHTTGGTQSYTYSWNTGSQDTAIYNLKAGTYILSVTDSHGCKDTATQELVDPEELQNSLTPSHTICKNGELKIDEGDLKSEDLHYFWRLPNEMIHNERVLVVNSDMPEGDYIMVTQDSKECFTKDTTNIKFSDNELEIKFLAPTYSYLGDTVVLAEDSEIFTDYTWSYQFNNDMFEDITSSMYNTPKNQTFLLSLTSGSDTITMYANDGKCNASYSKVVNILNEQRSDYSNYEAPSAGIFTRLAIGPSPNDGNFTLYANLTEEAALDVFILDLQTALKIPLKYDFKFVSDHYTIPVHNLNLLKGVYALFVTANGDTKYVKFTVK